MGATMMGSSLRQRIGAGLAIAAACGAFAVGAASAEAALTLKAQPAFGKQADALPRIAGTSASIRKINAALARGDARLKKAIGECRDSARSMDAPGWSWTRQVSAPMRGPAFVSVIAQDEYDCGGAHPDGSTLALTYDLSTGGPIDWSHYLPAKYAAEQGRSTASDGTIVGTVTARALLDWYRVVALEQLDASLKADCKDVLDGSVQGVVLWIDARRGGVALQAADLPHVVAACAAQVVMPLSELRKLGASAKLIDAIDTAHRTHAWTNDF
jgi:hypothetical protein